MLNLFIHDFNLVLAQYSDKGDKTNEEGYLRQHAEELFEKYPFVQLLTDDAAFSNRPLLKVLNRLHLLKDRWWDEDKHVLTRPGLGEIWSALTDLAVSLLWSWGEKGKPMTKRAMAVE